MNVKVYFFAGLKDALGAQLSIELDKNARYADVRKKLNEINIAEHELFTVSCLVSEDSFVEDVELI